MLMAIASSLVSLTATAAPAPWPPREMLVRSVVAGVEPVLKTYHPETGRFGSEPWICSDQNVLFALAAAWALEDPANPWFHNARLLEAIAKGGEALTADQDAKGMWTFRKKDNSTWGQIHMPWTYSRWVRAWLLVRDALPAAARAAWEKGLRLGFTGIRKYADGGIHNIPCHHAMGLYFAGQAFDNAEWREAAANFLHKVVGTQDPAGFWTEHFGPVVGYNEVYVDALGIYYGASRDPAVLPALERSARFHSGILWPDGSSVAAIDERQIYHAGRETGNVGFSWTPEGRGFLSQQLAPYLAPDKVISADYAAALLLYGGAGDGVPPAASRDAGRSVLGANDALIERRKPWQWCFSAYACEPSTSRWIQDRHNLVDVFHDDLGLVAGGGNTKLQPYWSTFTVGDPALLQHRAGDENPQFKPAIDLAWYPTKARLELAEGAPARLELEVGGVPCQVLATPRDDGALALTWRAQGAGQRVEARLPLLVRKGRLELANGRRLSLGEQDLHLTSAELGDGFTYAGLRVDLPPGAELRWPARQHDPYKKDGSSPLKNAKLVVVLPFAGGQGEQTVVLSKVTEPPFDGLAFEARDLPAVCSEGAYLKKLDDLRSLFLGARKPGDQMTLTLPAVKAGRYELLLEFVQAYSYGIVEVAVDGRTVGGRFDGYAEGVDDFGERVSFGDVDLTAGEHRVTVTVVGRGEQAKGQLISVQRVLLRRR